MQLLESSAPRRRSRGGTAVSILVHVALIGGAIAATARANTPERAEVVDDLVYVAPPEPRVERTTAAPRTTSSSPAPTTATSELPRTPMPDLSRIPVGIPPVPTGPDPLRGIAESFERGRIGGSAGEGTGTGAPSGDAPWDASVVDRAAAPLGQVRPRYPDALRSAGLGGRVVLRFVVDTLGRVEAGTVELVSTTHPLFGDAARGAIGSLRFRPAEARGRHVRQLVELPFEFVIQ